MCVSTEVNYSPGSTAASVTASSQTCRQVCVVPVSSSGSQLDVQRCDSELFAALSDVLSCQHGGVRRRLVSVRLHLHPAGHSADCLPGNTWTNQTPDSQTHPVGNRSRVISNTFNQVRAGTSVFSVKRKGKL